MSGDRNRDTALQAQIHGLTSSLSLMRSSSSNYTSPPTNAASESNLLFGRLKEMEERQRWLEGLIGGVGDSDTELEEIRSKRIALEERQIILELELQKWKRILQSEDPAVSLMKCDGKCMVKNVCGVCEKLKEEKLNLAQLQAEVRNKVEELKSERAQMDGERAQMEHEKIVLQENRRKLSEQAKALQTQISKDQIPKQICPSCACNPKVQRHEESLLRNLCELGKEKAALQGEKAWIDCVKRDLEKSRHEIQEQRKEIEYEKMHLENKRKMLKSLEKNMASTSNFHRSSTIETENLRRRELEVAKKSQELQIFKSELEKKQQELCNARHEMEQQWEHLFDVQKALEYQKNEVEKRKSEIASAQSLTEKGIELKLLVEKEKTELLKNKLMKERERLNQRDLEIEAKFNLLELQTQAISGAEYSQRTARVRHEVLNPQPQTSSFNVTNDRRPLLGARTQNRR